MGYETTSIRMETKEELVDVMGDMKATSITQTVQNLIDFWKKKK